MQSLIFTPKQELFVYRSSGHHRVRSLHATTPHLAVYKIIMEILILISMIAVAVLGQAPSNQNKFQLADCISGAPDSLGLSGPFSEGLVPASCVAICTQRNLELTFITGGSNARCYCANSVPTPRKSNDILFCQSPCTDGVTIGCGSNGLFEGSPAFAVYVLDGNQLRTTPFKLTDPLTLLPRAMYVYIGFSGIVGIVVFIISTFAWIARGKENRKSK